MKKILLVLVLFITLFLVGCGAKDKGIVGKWKSNEGDFVYTFNEDGSGSYEYYGAISKFTYEIEGDRITIIYTGSAPFRTKYTLNGNKLNIIDSFGEDTIYYRK